MPGTFSPATDFKGNRKLAIPACITARAWRTCRDACRDRLPAVTGKTFPAFPAHAHPQFCVSGKRPIGQSYVASEAILVENWKLNHMNTHLKKTTITKQNKGPQTVCSLHVIYCLTFCGISVLFYKTSPTYSERELALGGVSLLFTTRPQQLSITLMLIWVFSCWTSICFHQQTHPSDQWGICTNAVH